MNQNIPKLVLVAVLFAMVGASVVAQDKPSETPTDRESIRGLLRQFRPSAKQDAQVAKLIEQLGADEFSTREAAVTALLKMPVTPRQLLNRALKHSDAEVRLRARQVLARAGDDDQQRLRELFEVIVREKVTGLTSDLIPALELVQTARRLAVKTLVATALPEDVAILRNQLKATSPVVREAVVTALAIHAGKNAIADLRSVLSDADEGVLLAAAKALADRGDRACLSPLVRLLASKQFDTRYQSIRILRFITKTKFGYRADIDATAEEAARQAQVEAVESWRSWVKENAKTVALTFPVKLDDVIQLFNGSDLAGWQPVVTGVPLKLTDVWQAKNGVIVCNGNGNGYLRTKRKFANYQLTVDYRWPGQGGDSGVWIMMPGPDARLPRGLEVQLLSNKAGDFWSLGGFTCKVRGKALTGYGAKIAPSSEKPLGQWNSCVISVLNGKMTVKINGTEQNNAHDCPKEPGHIALQVEGTPIEFRRVELKPLGT